MDFEAELHDLVRRALEAGMARMAIIDALMEVLETFAVDDDSGEPPDGDDDDGEELGF